MIIFRENNSAMDHFIFGIDQKTKSIKHITEVKGGLACNCNCPNCGKELVAAHGQKTDWYFRHHEPTDCEKGPEMGFLKLVQEVIKGRKNIVIPDNGSISYTDFVINKKPQYLPFVPDVILQTETGEVFVELLTDNQLSGKKRSAYREAKLNSIEIDFRDYDYKNRKKFELDLLQNIRNKKIVYWKDGSKKSLRLRKNRSLQTIALLMGSGIVLGTIAILDNLTSSKTEPEKLDLQSTITSSPLFKKIKKRLF